MSVIRAKTLDLKQIRPLSKKRQDNSSLNEHEAINGITNLKSYPRRLVLEMTSACNINCKMCGRNAVDFKPTVFNPEWLEIFEPITEYVEEVTLLGWGEPTLHPQFSDFLKWGDEHGLRKFFCTNGTRLDMLLDDIFKYNVELLTVSLDGADAKTNNNIRCGADFDKIICNITNIVEKKKSLNSEFPYLSIVMTMMESNYRQMPEYVKLAAKLGIQEIKGVYLTVFEKKMLDEMMYNKTSEIKKVFDETIQLGEELGIQVKLPYIQGEDIAGEQFHKNCYVGWRDFFLGSDGYVRSCMSTSKKLFNVADYTSFDDMWNSKEYIDFRSKVNSYNMDIPCKNCYQASYANWNRESSFIQIGNEFAPEWQ
ncbi:MAG: radical SAM protein [Lachnospiraceae bacterium]|nr:radical SAM protein [Lachnospiraceae bacterium]